MRQLKFSALLTAAAFALAPAHVAAQPAAKPVSMGLTRVEVKPEGFLIVSMRPDGTAAAVGMKVGDLVLEVGGRPISPDVAEQYVEQLKEGDEVSFKVKRAGEVLELIGKAVAEPDGPPAPAVQPQQ